MYISKCDWFEVQELCTGADSTVNSVENGQFSPNKAQYYADDHALFFTAVRSFQHIVAIGCMPKCDSAAMQ